MPHHCCVPGCTQNSGAKVAGDPVSFHSFPKDEKLRREWIVKIRRDEGKYFQINESTKVCSIHFEEKCFSSAHRRREDEKKITSIKRRNLNKDALPTVFFWSSTTTKRKPAAVRSPLPPPKRSPQSAAAAAACAEEGPEVT